MRTGRGAVLRGLLLVVSATLLASGGIGFQATSASAFGEPGIVKDLVPGKGGSYPQGFTAFDGSVFFSASVGRGSSGPWMTHGTRESTHLVKRDLSNIAYFTPFNGYLYFIANHDSFEGLWRSDGTEDGTVLIKRFGNERVFASVYGMESAGGSLFLNVERNNLRAPWVSDGTFRGTRVLPHSRSLRLSNPDSFVAFKGSVYFLAYSPRGRALVKIGKSGEGAKVLVRLKSAFELTLSDHALYFVGDDRKHGAEPWRSTGSGKGTRMVRDIFPGSQSSYATGFVQYRGRTYFSASNAIGYDSSGLWATSGTAKGTHLLKLCGPLNITRFRNRLYFSGSSLAPYAQLWTSRGTNKSTHPIRKIGGRSQYNFLGWFTLAGEHLYFVPYHGSGRRPELWRSDGTKNGTKLLRLFSGTSRYTEPSSLAYAGGSLYFAGFAEKNGYELWSIPNP